MRAEHRRHPVHQHEVKQRGMEGLLQGLSSIEERLFNEILQLREEKLDAINKLNEERERSHDLERRYVQLEREYYRLVEEIESQGAPENRGSMYRRGNRSPLCIIDQETKEATKEVTKEVTKEGTREPTMSGDI